VRRRAGRKFARSVGQGVCDGQTSSVRRNHRDVNKILDGDCAAAIAEIFSEVIVAPDFSAEALEILQKKKNLRLLKF
jgi:hypothetical protein